MMDNDYAQELTKHAVIRACAALGIKQIREECLDTLADVVRHYIQSIGVASKENAELSGRAVPGIHDVIPALEHVHPVSTRWHDLKTFAFSNDVLEDEDGTKIMKWHQPFPFDVPHFPLDEGNEVYDDVNDVRGYSTSKDPTIPSHLPAFPHAQTYKKQASSRKRSHGEVSAEGAPSAEKRAKSNVVKSARQSLAQLEDSADEVAILNQQTKVHTVADKA